MNPFNYSNGFPLENQSSTSECSDRELGNVPRFEITFPDQTLANQELSNVPRFEISYPDQEQSIGGTHLLQNQPVEDDPDDDCGFADGVLKYIEQMLMEEGMDEQTHMLEESLDFQAKERSFYEVLVDHSSGSKHLTDVVDPSSHNIHTIYRTNNMTSVVDEFSYPPQINDSSESEVVLNFQKGVNDANKLLLIGSSTMSGIDDTNIEGKLNGSHLEEARGKRNPSTDLEEERSKRVAAVYAESNNVPTEEFDEVLLLTIFDLEKKFEACAFQAKGRHRCRNHNNKQVIDLRSLLIHCAKSIADNDSRATDELLKQIRQHSSPFGDGEQRLAHYFANGLEARLAGIGSQMRKSCLVKRTTASDYLRAYYTYTASSPFVKISNFVSNKMILNKSEKENAARVHVIDFGILYGFQWPIYIQRLAEREGGPPKLKITGIDFPQPGFRPAERVEETGRRLARYAEKFNVPFEFNAIAQNWESIKIEDLKLEKGEFVSVNCSYRADNLSDVEGVGESPRTMVLDLIRKINPDYFVHGVVSVASGSAFFVPRFREALFHYSTLYDMLETTIPREKPERAMLESDVFGKEALNVIACEDGERHGRTETYKQWRLRHLRAGFVQVPFERELMYIAKDKVRNLYHRDFLIFEDNDWLLMGWKGRILYATSCWRPV